MRICILVYRWTLVANILPSSQASSALSKISKSKYSLFRSMRFRKYGSDGSCRECLTIPHSNVLFPNRGS